MCACLLSHLKNPKQHLRFKLQSQNVLWQKQRYSLTFWSKLLSAVTYRQRSLQFAGDCAEAVEHQVFTHTVDPLAAGRQSAAHKVTTFPLTRAETSHNLQRECHTCIQTHTEQKYGKTGRLAYLLPQLHNENTFKILLNYELNSVWELQLFGVYSGLFNTAEV